jgi:hypothetical protein
MAEAAPPGGSGKWVVHEDGCLPASSKIQSITYHPSLNVVLMTTETGMIQVIDVTSGAIFHNSDLSGLHWSIFFLQSCY